MAAGRIRVHTRSMNDMNSPEGPPAEPGGPQGEAGPTAANGPHAQSGPRQPPRATDGFFGWLRGLGIVRSSSDRWFAGVAAGIASRANIDPLIVRGIFVVLAVLGGPGLFLYLAGWLLLPDPSGKIHLEELFRGRARPGVIVAAVLIAALVLVPVVVATISGIFRGPTTWVMWDVFGVPDWVQVTASVIWWAVLLPAAIIWLIVWISRGGLRRANAAADPAWTQKLADDATTWGQKVSEDATAWGQKASEQATAWGQKVEQDTTAWAERERLRYEARKLGAGHILITFALALLAAGGVAAWALSIGEDGRFVYTTSIVAAVAVCALSMIIAGVRGKYSGWVGFAALVGAIALLFTPYTSLMPDNLTFRPVGDAEVRVTENTPADSGLAVFAGNATLDLSELDARDSGRTIEVWMFAGNVDIELPDDHPTRVTVNLLAGNTIATSTDGETRTTRGPFQVYVTGANLTGAATTDITEVQVRMLAGNARIDGTESESEATR